MATISKRGSRWSVQIRRKGVPSSSRTFGSRAEARAWGIAEESRVERGEPVANRAALSIVTLGDILKRYAAEITPGKRSAESELLRLGKLRKDTICALSLAELTTRDISGYRDRRLRLVKPATVHRELAIISHALEVARVEWDISLSRNPARDVRLPTIRNARDRRLRKGEIERLDAQRVAVAAFMAGGQRELVGEIEEVESGKQSDNRPQLQEALRLCRLTGATLLVAKLDRLSRNAAFLMTLRDSGVRFVAADMPDANNLTVGIMALVAQQEREAISSRTKAALAAAKARGVMLGGDRGHVLPAREAAAASAKLRAEKANARARDIFSVIQEVRLEGVQSLREIAAGLAKRNIETPRGGTRWHPAQVKAVIDRAEGK